MRRLRQAEVQQPEPGPGGRLAGALLATLRSRNWVTGLLVPMLAAIAVGVAVVVIVGGNNGTGGPPPSPLSAGFPPASLATKDFTGTPALAGRGISEPLGQVAAFGSDIVAVGTQSGARIVRPRFFFSADAGRTWKLGTVRASGATQPPPGDAAAVVAGGPHGWVAVGPAAVWISRNGRDWLLQAPLPQLAGDKVTTLTATGSGFLAAGQHVPGGNAAKATPVVWLSANGTTWQRLGATRLGLGAAGGTVLGITSVAANGGAIVMTGTVSGAATGSGAWRSTDGGTSWTAVTIPAAAGVTATAPFSGVASLNGGFVTVRPAQVAGDAGAAVYTSSNGAAWSLTAQLKTADGAPLSVGFVSGGPGGAVVTGQARGLDIAFLSRDGVNWAGTDPVGTSAGEQISGAALTPAGQAVVAATSLGGMAGQPLLTLIGAHGGPTRADLQAISGAFPADVAVNAIAASAATQVAAGSADGFPALWVSADGGSTWARAVGSPAAVLSRPGEEQLTGVAHGAAGWLAVGGGLGSAPGSTPGSTLGSAPGSTPGSTLGSAAGPAVVVGSADGRTWTAADGAAAFTGPGQVVTAAVAAGRDGYVIVGHETSGGRTVAAAWYAPGLTGWLRGGDAHPGALDGAGDRLMNAVTATAEGFAAVGAVGPRPAVWLSAAGRTWSLVTLPPPASAVQADLRYVAADGDTVAAAGTAVTAAGQQLPFAAVSADGGHTWTETPLPAPRASAAAAVTALAAAGGGFTAMGTYGTPGNEDVVVWTLKRGAIPGTAWVAAAPAGTGLAGPGTQEITALTDSGSTLTGVGFEATSQSEAPTIWQSPVRS
jgi:hypothetical protein